MFNRPRCRDWTPLLTQQLRLRNLIQITGHNIICESKCFIYFTLHLTSMSAPFFTSEKLELTKNAIWPEINCQSIIKSTSNCVCIRVWQHKPIKQSQMTVVDHNLSIDLSSSLSPPTSSSSSSSSSSPPVLLSSSPPSQIAGHHTSQQQQQQQQQQDTILFLWGVHFSGLVPITKRTDIKLKRNSLVFFMHGGFFTSSDMLLPECIPKQIAAIGLLYQQQSIALLKLQNSNNSNENICDPLILSKLENQKINYNSNRNFDSDNNIDATAAADDDDDDDNNSTDQNLTCDLLTGGISNVNPVIVTSNINTKINSNELNPNVLRIRFIEKHFFKSEIRHSYNVEKLLLLQEKQRKIKYKSESSKGLIDKICMKSAFCLNLELFTNRTSTMLSIQKEQSVVTSSNSNDPIKNPINNSRRHRSIGLTLNSLLFQQPEQPKPEELLKAQELRRKIETAKFRCRILVQEQNHVRINIRHLEDKLGKLNDCNIEQESWLMANYRGLSREKESTVKFCLNVLSHRELSTKTMLTLRERRQQLLRELKEIYFIDRNDKGQFRINNIYLPNAESYTESISALDTSVALGYVAHIILMCSIILDVPLRNPIIFRGSASKIVDNIKLIPSLDREFPLYFRSNPPPDALLYGVFLLNQNIAQFKYLLGITKYDLRATLQNLLQLLDGMPKDVQEHQTSIVTTESSSIVNSETLAIQSTKLLTNPMKNNEEQRISRSVGSYTDNVEHIIEIGNKRKGHFTSEPILTHRKQIHNFIENGNI